LPIGENIFLSYNGGEDWMAIKSFDRDITKGKALSFDPKNPQAFYLASPRGILYSTNKGESFQTRETEFKTETEPTFISEAIYSPHNPEITYLISEEIGRNKVLVSYNRGETFRPIFVSPKNEKVSAFSVDPFFPYLLYIGTEKGVFLKSEDFGNSWEQKGAFSQKIGQITLSPHKDGEIYTLLSVKERDPFDYWSQRLPAKIMISQDGGNKFRELKTAINTFEMKEIIFDPIVNRVYFASSFSLLKKQGKKIETIKVISPSGRNKINSFTIDPKNSNILYLGIGELIYKSEDGGSNWQIIEPPMRGDINEIRVNPQDSRTLFLSIEKTL